MKNFLLVILLVLGLSFSASAQTISVSPSTPVNVMTFYLDSVYATDSSFAVFHVPFNMNILAVQAVATKVDTGSSGTGAGVISLYRYGTSTNIVSDSVVGAHAVMHEAPATAALGKLVKGGIYKLKTVQALSKKMWGLVVSVWFTR